MKLSKQMVTLNQDIAGQEIGIPVYHLQSDVEGAPTVYVQSAVHAAEMQGSAVIYELITALKSTNLVANFILVPNCNPFGRTQRAGEYLQGRFDATNGNNWNRFYYYNESSVAGFVEDNLTSLKTMSDADITALFRGFLAVELAQQLNSQWGVNTAQYLNIKLQQLANKADLVLDLHTGPSSTRHLYSPDFLVDEAYDFNIENIISIPVAFAGALDEASFTPWQELARELKEHDIDFDYRVKAFTVELGSQENICLAQANEDAKGLLHYLYRQNMVEEAKPITLKSINVTELKNYRTLYSPYAGMVEYIKKAGDFVASGETLARVLNSLEFDNEQAIREIKAPQSGTVILHYPSAAVQVGTQLYKIALDSE